MACFTSTSKSTAPPCDFRPGPANHSVPGPGRHGLTAREVVRGSIDGRGSDAGSLPGPARAAPTDALQGRLVLLPRRVGPGGLDPGDGVAAVDRVPAIRRATAVLDLGVSHRAQRGDLG